MYQLKYTTQKELNEILHFLKQAFMKNLNLILLVPCLHKACDEIFLYNISSLVVHDLLFKIFSSCILFIIRPGMIPC